MKKSKFLPFVSDSTPIHQIKEKLWGSGFGVPDNILLSILTLVEKNGIEKVRIALHNINHLDSWEDRYKEILKFEVTHTKKLTEMLKELGVLCIAEDWEGATEITNNDIFSVFASFSAHLDYSKTELSNFIHLGNLGNDEIAKGMFFSSSAETSITVSSIQQVYAYVFYTLFISKRSVVPVRLQLR